jgi:hypothetical protein
MGATRFAIDFSAFDVYNVYIDVGIVDNKERP